MARITVDSIVEAACRADHTDAEGLVFVLHGPSGDRCDCGDRGANGQARRDLESSLGLGDGRSCRARRSLRLWLRASVRGVDAMITIDDIGRAKETIASTIRPTPVNPSPSLSELAGAPVFLKLEHHQVTGSFKIRGAANAIANLDEGRSVAPVWSACPPAITAADLAYAARAAGVRCIICMSSLVPKAKIDGIKGEGAEVRIIGKSQDEAQIEVDRLVEEEGVTMIPPFDHADIIAGQGHARAGVVAAGVGCRDRAGAAIRRRADIRCRRGHQESAPDRVGRRSLHGAWGCHV